MNWDTKRYSEYTKRYSEYFVPKQEVTVPKQVRRTFPALGALLLLLLFLSGSFSSVNSRLFSSRDPHFPKKVWQIWKVGPLDMEEKDLNTARTWINKNPAFRYEVLTDANDLAYVETNFGPDGLNRLDIVHMYRSLTARIIKADLLRYMVMYIEGGVYTDIDVEALKPIRKFIPDRYQERDVDMVVGVEVDQPDFKNHPVLGQKCESFVQWTFMCRPRLPVMLKLVETIMAWIKTVADEQKVPISDIKLDFDQVISGTGPAAFTRAILADLSDRTGRNIGWNTFHDMDDSKLIGNLLVLNVEAFAAGQGHSDAGNHDTRHALVKHHYHASHWPDAHPRFNHPMFGEVEQCNWKPDCVRKWDEDTANWEKLTPEEQNKQLALKDFDERQKAEAEAAAEAAKNKPLMPNALPNNPPLFENQPNVILKKRGLEGLEEHSRLEDADDSRHPDAFHERPHHENHHWPSPPNITEPYNATEPEPPKPTRPWYRPSKPEPKPEPPRQHHGNGPFGPFDHRWREEEEARHRGEVLEG